MRERVCPSDRLRAPRSAFAAALLLAASACASLPMGGGGARPAALVGDWIDLSHTTAGDTALWVLREDGYDGAAHLVSAPDASSPGVVRRTTRRYGSWYLSGEVADTVHRSICFAHRVGRDGPTCVRFSVDTIRTSSGVRRRLIVHGYRGEHRTADRELLERINAGGSLAAPR